MIRLVVVLFTLVSGTLLTLPHQRPAHVLLTLSTKPVVVVTQPAKAESVEGGPSLSIAQVQGKLAIYHSPLSATTIYQESEAAQVDDGFALAIWARESGIGGNPQAQIAIRNHNPGNVRGTGYGGFQSYPSWDEGIKAWFHLIRDTYINKWHLTTPSQIIPVYCPWGDGANNPDLYTQFVHQFMH